MPANRRVLARAPRRLVGVDLPLDGVDVGDGGEIQVAAPDEGADLAQEMLAERAVAGHRPRLDHRRAFPILAHALVVGDGGVHGDGQRRRRRVRAQAEIGAENVALGGALLQQPHQVARDPDIAGAGAVLVVGCRVRVVEQHEVDIRGVVQLPRAELAHAEHEKAAACEPACLRIGPPAERERAQLAARDRGPEQVRAGEADRRLRQGGQRARHPVERPASGDVGRRRDQRHPPLGDAQRGAHRVPPGGARIEAAQAAQRVRQGRIRPAPRHRIEQRCRLPHREIGQEGAVAADRREQRRALHAGGEAPRLLGQFGETRREPLGGLAVVGQGRRASPFGHHGRGGEA